MESATAVALVGAVIAGAMAAALGVLFQPPTQGRLSDGFDVLLAKLDCS